MNGRPWSAGELNRLRDLYTSRPTKEIAKALGRSVDSVHQMAWALGLKKGPEVVAKAGFQKGSTVGQEFRFQKGQVPANKGLRRPGWHRGRMRETQFKKGERSGMAAKNWVPVGTILPDSDGYLRIKVREAVYGKEPTGWGNSDVWPQYHRCVWQQHKGPIPPKHIVTFKDGDKANCAIDNLELMSKRNNARRNAMWARLPRELAEAIQLNGVLKRKLRRLNGEEQNQRPAGPLIRDTRSVEGPGESDGAGPGARDQ